MRRLSSRIYRPQFVVLEDRCMPGNLLALGAIALGSHGQKNHNSDLDQAAVHRSITNTSESEAIDSNPKADVNYTFHRNSSIQQLMKTRSQVLANMATAFPLKSPLFGTNRPALSIHLESESLQQIPFKGETTTTVIQDQTAFFSGSVRQVATLSANWPRVSITDGALDHWTATQISKSIKAARPSEVKSFKDSSQDEKTAHQFNEMDPGGEPEIEDFWGYGPPPDDPWPENNPSPSSDQYVMFNFDADSGGAVIEQIPVVPDYQLSGPISLENDLVQLQKIDDTPPQDDAIATRGFSWYRLDVTYAGEGRIKLWNSPQKNLELPVGTQSTVGMTGYNGGFWFQLPGFYMEGIQRSEEVGDVSVELTVNWDVNGNPWTSHFRMRTITITPIVKEFTVTVNQPQLISNQPNPSQNGIFARSIFDARVDGRGAQGRPYFINNLRDFTNNLTGPPVHGMVKTTNVKWEAQPVPPNPLPHPDVNKNFWFLDRFAKPQLLQNGEYYPVYWDIYTGAGIRTNEDGTKSLHQYDRSGFPKYSAATVKEIDVTKKFRLYLVFESNDAAHSILPLAYVDYEVRTRFNFNQNPSNLSEPNPSQVINRVDSDEKPRMMKRLLANEVVNFVSMPGA